MAKKNQTLKEIIQIVVFFVVVGILSFVFVIYPLNRTKAIMARDNLDEYNADSLPANDPAVFVEAGLTVDTFWLEADGLTTLACLHLTPGLEAAEGVEATSTGTAILLHDEHSDRTAMLPLAQRLIEQGMGVVVYDQRASGLSTGEYHGDGQYEATDLEELISHLDIRSQLTPPVSVIGWQIGGDAALLASLEEGRINNVVAVSPYLSTERMIDTYRETYDTYWLPFFRTLFWWWYNTRSSYAAEYRDKDQIEGVASRTLLLVDETALTEPEMDLLREKSETDRLTIETLPAEAESVRDRIVNFILPTPETANPKPGFAE